MRSLQPNLRMNRAHAVAVQADRQPAPVVLRTEPPVAAYFSGTTNGIPLAMLKIQQNNSGLVVPLNRVSVIVMSHITRSKSEDTSKWPLATTINSILIVWLFSSSQPVAWKTMECHPPADGILRYNCSGSRQKSYTFTCLRALIVFSASK